MLWVLLPALALFALLLPLGAVAGPPPCQTKNVGTGVEYKGSSALATAISAAVSGATISVYGTCYGGFEVNKNLTLKGQGKNATLDGNGSRTVLHITNGTTTVNGLKITNGVADVESSPGAGNGCCVGGGIALTGDTAAATLVNSVVTGNSAGVFGGGIDVDEGTLDLVNSTVSGNTAVSGSGGIDLDFGTVTLSGSTVSGNSATDGSGGGIWSFGGTLTLTNSTVSGNSANRPGTPVGSGGGIRNQSALDSSGNVVAQATLTLSGTTTITGNHAELGGGIRNTPSSTVLASNWTGSITGNTPEQCNPALTIGTTSCGP